MPMWGWNGNWWVMAIWMVLFWAVIIGGIVVAVRALTGPALRRRDDAFPPSDAAGILEERFARGEIDEEEFRKRRDLLSAEIGRAHV